MKSYCIIFILFLKYTYTHKITHMLSVPRIFTHQIHPQPSDRSRYITLPALLHVLSWLLLFQRSLASWISNRTSKFLPFCIYLNATETVCTFCVTSFAQNNILWSPHDCEKLQIIDPQCCLVFHCVNEHVFIRAIVDRYLDHI